MGYTLDQLLDETGVTGLSGHTKKASKSTQTDFSKLAERCRRAATATSEEQTNSTHQELVEKTAAIAVIGRTLAEIQEIEGPGQEKTAAVPQPTFNVEAFINTALDAGHPPEKIAAFLEKNAGLGSWLGEWKAGRGLAGAAKATAKATSKSEGAIREMQHIARQAEGMEHADRAALISRWRRKFGDADTHRAISAMDSKAFKSMPEFKDLERTLPKPTGGAPGMPGGRPEHALGANIGGAHFGLSKEQLQKMKVPALAVGAGFLGHRALTSDDEKKSKHPGVVVVGGD